MEHRLPAVPPPTGLLCFLPPPLLTHLLGPPCPKGSLGLHLRSLAQHLLPQTAAALPPVLSSRGAVCSGGPKPWGNSSRSCGSQLGSWLSSNEKPVLGSTGHPQLHGGRTQASLVSSLLPDRAVGFHRREEVEEPLVEDPPGHHEVQGPEAGKGSPQLPGQPWRCAGTGELQQPEARVGSAVGSPTVWGARLWEQQQEISAGHRFQDGISKPQ